MNPEVATICGDLIHTYAKELSMPRILPKLTITLDDAI